MEVSVVIMQGYRITRHSSRRVQQRLIPATEVTPLKGGGIKIDDYT